MRRIFWFAWALLLCGVVCVQQSSAFWQSRDSNYNVAISAGAAYQGPGDVVSGATAYWGLRAYNVAYATGSNSAAVVCDSATFLVCTTINILANGSFDKATASGSSSCVSTCVVKSLTDQTGNGNTMSCFSASVCPTLTFNCYGSLPCLTFANAQTLSSSLNITSPLTYLAVTERTGNTGSFQASIAAPGNPFLGFNSSANTVVWDPNALVTAAGNDNSSHALLGTYDNTTSILFADGVEMSGVGSGGPSSGNIYLGSRNNTDLFLTGNITEAAAYSSVISPTNARLICHNEFSYWGTATSC